MRVACLLIASLGLFLGACSSKGGGKSHAPPPLNKDLLKGKWKSETDTFFLTHYEFGEGGIVKITFQGMKQPIEARYGWSGERTVDVEYPKDETIRKEYESAAKAYKEDLHKKIEAKTVSERAGPTLLRMVEDKLPDKEKLGVAISDPKYLILRYEGKGSRTFEREK